MVSPLVAWARFASHTVHVVRESRENKSRASSVRRPSVHTSAREERGSAAERIEFLVISAAGAMGEGREGWRGSRGFFACCSVGGLPPTAGDGPRFRTAQHVDSKRAPHECGPKKIPALAPRSGRTPSTV